MTPCQCGLVFTAADPNVPICEGCGLTETACHGRMSNSASFDALTVAAQEYLDAVTAYLDPQNQYTDSRWHRVIEARDALRAALG